MNRRFTLSGLQQAGGLLQSDCYSSESAPRSSASGLLVLLEGVPPVACIVAAWAKESAQPLAIYVVVIGLLPDVSASPTEEYVKSADEYQRSFSR